MLEGSPLETSYENRHKEPGRAHTDGEVLRHVGKFGRLEEQTRNTNLRAKRDVPFKRYLKNLHESPMALARLSPVRNGVAAMGLAVGTPAARLQRQQYVTHLLVAGRLHRSS
jgi:hypothetical protein